VLERQKIGILGVLCCVASKLSLKVRFVALKLVLNGAFWRLYAWKMCEEEAGVLKILRTEDSKCGGSETFMEIP
jgi:hypothetical protein